MKVDQIKGAIHSFMCTCIPGETFLHEGICDLRPTMEIGDREILVA